MLFDKWQEEVLECKSKRILICKGRQIGGTTVLAKKASDRLANNPHEEIMVVSITEEQAQHVIMMVLQFLEHDYKQLLSRKLQDTTKGKILLKNGSSIISKAIGTTGASIRGFTKGVLWINEGSRIPEFAFEASKAMLLTTGGELWMDSTPFGKQGYFYKAYENKNGIWTVFYKTTVDVINERPISVNWTEKQRKEALELLEQEKNEMTELQFGQEYLGLFLEDLKRMFSDELISKVCILKRDGIIRGKTYMGIDCAGMGKDLNTFEVVDKIHKTSIRQIENITTTKKYVHETVNTAIELFSKFHVRRIGVDDGGVGWGVFSDLLNNTKTRTKTIALNNASRPLDKDDKQHKKILKTDMYFNLLNLMEKGELKLLDDKEIKDSLASVQISNEDGKWEIWGKDTHIAEGLTRSLWLAKQDNALDLYCSY